MTFVGTESELLVLEEAADGTASSHHSNWQTLHMFAFLRTDRHRTQSVLGRCKWVRDH